MKNILSLSDLLPSDIIIGETDCGPDVQKVSDNMGWYNFPCLDSVVILMVKKLISNIVNKFDNDFDGTEVDDEPSAGYSIGIIEYVPNAVNLLHKNKRHDRLLAIQLRSNLSIKKEKCTHWNSLNSIMKRFIEMKDYIPMLLTEDEFPADFKWDKLQH